MNGMPSSVKGGIALSGADVKEGLWDIPDIRLFFGIAFGQFVGCNEAGFANPPVAEFFVDGVYGMIDFLPVQSRPISAGKQFLLNRGCRGDKIGCANANQTYFFAQWILIEQLFSLLENRFRRLNRPMEGSASCNLVEISMLDFKGDGPRFEVQSTQLASDVFGVVQQEVA